MPFYKKPIYLIYYDKRSFVSIMAKSQEETFYHSKQKEVKLDASN